MSTQFVEKVERPNSYLEKEANGINLFRLGGYTTVIGAISFVVGAICWAISGTDIDLAVTHGDMATYLTTAGQNKLILNSGLVFWIAGALILGFAGVTMAKLGQRQIPRHIADFCFRTAVPIVIVAYFAMLSVNTVLAPAATEASYMLAQVIGWLGSRADWLATVLMIGLGPLFVALAGQDNWVPVWLKRISYLNGFCALLTTLALFTGELGSYGFVIIPVGIIWMLAAGVVQLQRVAN